MKKRPTLRNGRNNLPGDAKFAVRPCTETIGDYEWKSRELALAAQSRFKFRKPSAPLFTLAGLCFSNQYAPSTQRHPGGLVCILAFNKASRIAPAL
jgi:hypothetical protein